MYIDDISFQLNVFLYSVGFGFILGVIYDVFRIIRVLIIRNNSAVVLQDIAYFCVCAVLTFVFLLVVNNGRFRFNVLVALVLGFAAYYFTLGNYALKFAEYTAGKLKIIINAVSRFITAPYRLALRIFGKNGRKLYVNLKNIEKSRKKAEKTLENKE